MTAGAASGRGPGWASAACCGASGAGRGAARVAARAGGRRVWRCGTARRSGSGADSPGTPRGDGPSASSTDRSTRTPGSCAPARSGTSARVSPSAGIRTVRRNLRRMSPLKFLAPGPRRARTLRDDARGHQPGRRNHPRAVAIPASTASRSFGCNAGLAATTSPEAKASPPSGSVTNPPASRTIRMPAAMSHGFRCSSQ